MNAVLWQLELHMQKLQHGGQVSVAGRVCDGSVCWDGAGAVGKTVLHRFGLALKRSKRMRGHGGRDAMRQH